MMNNRLKKLLLKVPAVIFGITAFVSIWLLGTVWKLNMLPTKYMAIIIFAVVLFLVGTGLLTCILPWQYKLQDGKLVKADKTKEQKAKEAKKRSIYRLIGMFLCLALVLVDVVGIRMVNQLQNTISNITLNRGQDETATAVMEVVGVYVSSEDGHAEELKDIASYDLGMSYAYNQSSMETAVSRIETAFDKEFDWDEYATVAESVDALLEGDADAILLNVSYVSVLEGMEGYEDIQSKIKLIHEFEMEDTTIPVIDISTKPENITEEPFIVYISGNDTNYSMTNVRSDVNILAVVNPVTKQVLLINTPRDYYVELTGSGSGDGQLDKLTHCGIYGIECSMATLGNLYDQDVHYYAQVSFVGFKRLIDAMGGITVYSDATFYAAQSGTQIYKGENYLNGEEALGFVRERYNLADGDNARGRHQMAVIQAIIKKAASGAILTHYSDILESMGGCFGTNLSNEEASDLVKMQLNDMATWNIKSFAVQGEGNGASKPVYSIPGKNQYVMIQNEQYISHAKTLIDKVFDGQVLTDADMLVE